MADYQYYGLFLTQESKDKLREWLFNNAILDETEWVNPTMYLDHCTLVHKSHNNPRLAHRVDEALRYFGYMDGTIRITGIGVSDKALAFRVDLPSGVSANKIPHITICTFNGGKPVDSNNITEWKDIEPIVVKVKLEKSMTTIANWFQGIQPFEVSHVWRSKFELALEEIKNHVKEDWQWEVWSVWSTKSIEELKAIEV